MNPTFQISSLQAISGKYHAFPYDCFLLEHYQVIQFSTQFSPGNIRKVPRTFLRLFPSRTFPGNPIFQLSSLQAISRKFHAFSYVCFHLEHIQVIPFSTQFSPGNIRKVPRIFLRLLPSRTFPGNPIFQLSCLQHNIRKVPRIILFLLPLRTFPGNPTLHLSCLQAMSGQYRI